GLGGPGGRLGQQIEARLGRERARDTERPLAAVRQRHRRLDGPLGEPECSEQLHRADTRIATGGTDAEGGDLDVLANREPLESMSLLKRAREPGAATALRRPPCDVTVL